MSVFVFFFAQGGGVQRQQQVLPAPPDEADVKPREVKTDFQRDRNLIKMPLRLTAPYSNEVVYCLTRRNFVLKHRVFLVRNWEKMRGKQELLKREGEREREKESSLSQYARWGGVIRDDGNIKSGACAHGLVYRVFTYCSVFAVVCFNLFLNLILWLNLVCVCVLQTCS